MKDVFQQIHDQNGWQDDESVSGHGSTLDATLGIREQLPKLFQELRVKKLLDIPCGDFHWWKEMELPGIKYLGADIVPELVAKNQELYGDDLHKFMELDITEHFLGDHDLIFVRDLFGHFSDSTVTMALWNIKRTRAKWLLATTFPDQFNQFNIKTGQWRAINLEYGFNLGKPERVINEGNHLFKTKSLGLWRLR